MTETSRPRCTFAAWCAKPPHPASEGCSIAVRRPPEETAARLQVIDLHIPMRSDDEVRRIVDEQVARFVASQPAVGGTVNQPHLTVPADRVTDVTVPADPDDTDRWIAAIRKANDTADEYQAIAYELSDLINRYRGLKSRRVQSPEDGEDTSPALLESSLVKLDMTEHLCRLERFQVAAMGAAGSWRMLGEQWNAGFHEDLAANVAAAQAADQVRRCRVCGCTDDLACENGCAWVEYDLCSECVDEPAGVVDATGIEYAAVHGEEDGR